jgi:hypothetical protein
VIVKQKIYKRSTNHYSGSRTPRPRSGSCSGIFDGVHSILGDLVDLLTCNDTFTFLEDLHTTGRLWDLRNFRIPRLVPRGTASKDFGDSLRAILALAGQYPAQSLPFISSGTLLNSFPPFSMPCSRRAQCASFSERRVEVPLESNDETQQPRAGP